MRSICYSIIILALLSVLITSCRYGPNPGQKCGPCPLYAEMLPNISFRLVDKTSNQDLFFGPGAPYKFSQLVMWHIVNGKPDSANLRIDTINHFFNVFVPPSHMVDTVTMKVANKPTDTLLFHTGSTGGCCPRLLLLSVSFDGNTVYTTMDGNKVVVLQE